jgi:hypothetical protein
MQAHKLLHFQGYLVSCVVPDVPRLGLQFPAKAVPISVSKHPFQSITACAADIYSQPEVVHRCARCCHWSHAGLQVVLLAFIRAHRRGGDRCCGVPGHKASLLRLKAPVRICHARGLKRPYAVSVCSSTHGLPRLSRQRMQLPIGPNRFEQVGRQSSRLYASQVSR